ncbi:hypothetical protein FOL47_000921 [Perkinsus chesapeaki]|uniref:CCR4-NOT transcription complex subunit 1 n=1 Tax=Perkinsus chesapeaki TaxID=330153 RepID=A0A7J6N0X9_PERCH|nr:hypothetical protein FOL47_000921 [Perkinsus chesapeaki]
MSEPPADQGSSSNVLEDTVNKLFNRLYNGEMSTQDLVNMMLQFSREPDVGTPPTNHQIFEHMIVNLCDELRFITRYPSNELRITAELIGQLLRFDLVSQVHEKVILETKEYSPLQICMRVILDSLKRPPYSRMFRFGVLIIEQFLDRIARWPQLCAALVSERGVGPQFKSCYPDYYNYLVELLNAIPAEYRDRPVIDHSLLLQQWIHLPPAPELYPPPLQEKEERELHAARVAAFKAGKPMPPPHREMPAAAAPATSGEAQRGSSPESGSPQQRQPPAIVPVDRILADEKVMAGITPPPDWFCDMTMQTFNSLTPQNVGEKAAELRENMKPEYFQWFSMYMVKSRVTKEVNLQPLFLQFLDCLGQNKLIDYITQSTFTVLHLLLSDEALDMAVVSPAHRTALKNLGTWLGSITIGRNRALKAKDLDLKQLLLDSYSNGRLTATLPLACKILESLKDSRTYRPPNPWSNAQLSLLAEIHDIPNLRTNLVFEIELLARKLDLSPSFREYKKTDLLAGRNMPEDSPDISRGPHPIAAMAQNRVEPQRPHPSAPPMGAQPAASPQVDFSQRIANAMNMANLRQQQQAQQTSSPPQPRMQPMPSAPPQRPMPPAPVPSVAAMQPASSFAAQAQGAQQQQGGGGGENEGFILPNLPSLVIIDPNIELFRLQPKLKPIVPLAMDRAIRDIVTAGRIQKKKKDQPGGRMVVLKDLAMEPDEQVVRKAAQLMVTNLAGALALVTCREPLRISLTNHLKALLNPGNAAPPQDYQENALIDQVISTVTAENLELGCQLIEKIVCERAVKEIDVVFHPAYEARRSHREKYGPNGPQFVDTEFYNVNGTWPNALPSSLRPRPGPLPARELRVYRDFLTKVRAPATGGVPPPMSGAVPADIQRRIVGAPPGMQPTAAPQPPALPSLVQVQSIVKQLHAQAAGAVHQLEVMSSDANQAKIWRFTKTLLTSGLEEVVSRAATNERVLTMPEISDTQRPQLDSFYALVGLCSLNTPAEESGNPNAGLTGWQLLLKNLDEILKHDPGLATVVVSHVLKEMNRRFDQLAAMYVGVNVLAEKTKTDAAGAVAVKQQLQWSQSHVTEPHVRLELHLAMLGVVLHTVGTASEDTALRVVQTPLLAFCVELLHKKLLGHTEDGQNQAPSTEAQRQALQLALCGVIRYSLVKESEVDTILQRLLTEYKSPQNTMFVVTFLQLVLNKMRISTVQSWVHSIEVIQRIGLRLREQMQQPGSHLSTLEKQLAMTTAQFVEACKHSAQVLYPERALTLNKAPQNAVPPEAIHYLAIHVPPSSQLQPPSSTKPFVDQIPDATKKSFIEAYDEWRKRTSEEMNFPCEEPTTKEALKTLKIDYLNEYFISKGLAVGTNAQPTWFPGFLAVVLGHVIDLASKETMEANKDSENPEKSTHETELKFDAIDCFASLVVLLTLDPARPTEGPADAPTPITTTVEYNSIRMLHKALEMISRHIWTDANTNGDKFNQRFYTRMLSELLQKCLDARVSREILYKEALRGPQPIDPLSEKYLCAILSAFAKTLSWVGPGQIPQFVFGWTSLLTDDKFFPRLMQVRGQRGWLAASRLIQQLLRYIAPHLANSKDTSLKDGLARSVPEPIRVLYTGLLKIWMTAIQEDYPEFLSDFQFSLVSELPENCVQAKNMILCAFPRGMKLPDPFALDLQVDTLPDVKIKPRVLLPETTILEQAGIIQLIDEYVKVRDRTLLDAVIRRMHGPTGYNHTLMTSVVQYIGTRLPMVCPSYENAMKIGGNVQVEIFMYLACHFDPEGRYIFLSTIVNFLRYPNSHTHYFSCLILNLFGDAPIASVREQIARILLERLIVRRPHPWGLLITFIELVKNPRYRFWEHPFMKNPDVEKLFRTVKDMSIELDRAIGSNHSEEFRGLAAWSSGDLSKYASAMGGAVCLQSADDQQDPQQFLTKAFSMKCSTMAVGNREGSGLIAAGFTGDQADVLLWRDGELLYRLEEHDEAVTALAFTCDDRFLVSTGGMNDQRLYVWDCERGLVITCRSLATLVPVKAIVDGGFVKDVKRRNTSLYQLASCGGRNVTIWELNDEVQSITPVSISPSGKHTRAFECLCFSKDYELLFIGTSSGDIAVVKMRNRVVQSFSEPVGAGGIFSLAYLDAAGDLAQGSSPAVLAGSGDGSVTLFSCILTELRQLKRVVVDQGTIVGMSVGRRRQILCASTTGSVWLLWPDKDMATALVQENTSAPLQAVAYPMPDISTEFAVGDASGAVTLWSCDGSYSVIMKLAARPTASSPVSAVTCLGYLSRAGLLVAGHSDGLLRSWNCGDDNGTLLWTIDTTTTRGRTNRASDVGALAMSSNGRFVVTGGGEGEVRVWEVKSKDMVSGMKEHTSRVNALKLFSNDQFCVTGSRDRCLLTFDLRAEKRLTCHRERHGGIDCLAIGTDENVVVAGGKEKHLTYWDLRQPEPVRVVSAGPGDELKALSFHDDGKGGLLASGGTGCVVKLWEMGSGRLISTHLEEPRHSSCINDLAFSPDGKQLISVGADHCVMVWNVFPNDPPEAGA